MKIKPFALERYFAKYEFSARYLLSSSDCDGLKQSELLVMADDQTNKLWKELRLGYTESLGLPLLRQEVSKLYEGISADDVLIVVPEEGIFMALNCLLETGDHVICAFPGYQSLYQVAESLGCVVDKWAPVEEEGWRFRIEDLEAKITPRTKLIIVNFPHNPTGYLPNKDDFLKIVKLAKDNGIYLFSDEMYRFLELNRGDRLPSASEVYDKAVSLFGMSKTFGMAGARIGWLVTKDRELYGRMAAFKDYLTICSSASSEILSLIALRNRDRIIEKHLVRIKKNLTALDEFFQKHTEMFSWVKPKSGTICFPKLLFNESASQFCERVVREAGIMLLPSTVYDYGNKHIRIGFGRENMPEVLGLFEDHLIKRK